MKATVVKFLKANLSQKLLVEHFRVQSSKFELLKAKLHSIPGNVVTQIQAKRTS